MADIAINDVTPQNRYVAAGGETDFDYVFPIFDADHLRVQETDPDDLNNPVTLVRGVDYAVTGVNVATGGTVVLDTGVYPSGAIADNIYTITRILPYERLNDYQFSGDFEAGDVNVDYDSIVMMVQQLNLSLQKTVRLNDTDQLTSLPITVEATADRQGRALSFNAAGTALVAGPSTTDIANAATNAAAAAAALDEFTDIYLGAKASDPTLDNDGDALQAGAFYFNTTSDVLRYYDGAMWNNITTPSTPVADDVTYDNATSGLTAMTVQAALDEIDADLDTAEATIAGLGALAALDTVGTTEIDDDAVTAAKLADTAVTPGAYTNANITVDQQGRITAAANGEDPGWTYVSSQSLSGSSITFSSLPAGITEIEVFTKDATHATGDNIVFQCRLGDSGGVESSGYNSRRTNIADAGISTVTATTHFDTGRFARAAVGEAYDMTIKLKLTDASANLWYFESLAWSEVFLYHTHSSGKKGLSATLDRVQLLPASGSFGSGTAYLRYR